MFHRIAARRGSFVVTTFSLAIVACSGNDDSGYSGLHGTPDAGLGTGGYGSGSGGYGSGDGGRSGISGSTFSSGARSGLGSGGHEVVPAGECFDVQCKAPPCCGGNCTTNADCCKGTICGKSGRCIPDSCEFCGPSGCTVDFDTCTAECVPPTCCKDACQTDADCCPGTMCGKNTKTCIPTSCNGCQGMRNLCTTKADCSTQCVPPDNCGIVCTTDADCGLGGVCNTFLDGQKLCVPDDFKDECAACGSAGCRFIGKTCDIECKTLGAGGSPSVGSGGTVGAGGSVFVESGGTTSVSTGGTTSVTPTLLDCCDPCTNDDQCSTGYCSINTLTGSKQCTPSECRYCDNGCTYKCNRP